MKLLLKTNQLMWTLTRWSELFLFQHGSLLWYFNNIRLTIFIHLVLHTQVLCGKATGSTMDLYSDLSGASSVSSGWVITMVKSTPLLPFGQKHGEHFLMSHLFCKFLLVSQSVWLSYRKSTTLICWVATDLYGWRLHSYRLDFLVIWRV